MRIIVCDRTGQLQLDMRRRLDHELQAMGRSVPLLEAADVDIGTGETESRSVRRVWVTLRVAHRAPLTVTGARQDVGEAATEALQLAESELGRVIGRGVRHGATRTGPRAT